MFEDLRQFAYFHIFGLGIASVGEKKHLAIPLARSCQYLSRCKKYQSIPNGSRIMPIFTN